MSKVSNTVLTLACVMVLSVSTTAADAPSRANPSRTQSHLIGLEIDPNTSVVRILPTRSRGVVNSSFSMVSANCMDCGSGCPPTERTVEVVLEATADVVAGYGVSNLSTTNFDATNVGYSTQERLSSGPPADQLTITIDGEALTCGRTFKLYFSMCEVEPADPAGPCAPPCSITSPPPGATLSGDVLMGLDTSSPSGNPLTAAFDYDAGGGFMPATDSGIGALTGNPTGQFFAGATSWAWDTSADFPTSASGVVFRVTVIDDFTGSFSTCSANYDVNNTPTCSITSPPSGALLSGDVLMGLDTSGPSGNDLTAAFDFSLGGPFFPAYDSGGGVLTGNPSAPFAAGATSWQWGTSADIPTRFSGIEFRVTITDSVTGSSSTCSADYDVDNTPTCSITSPPSGAAVSGDVMVDFNASSPSGHLLTADLEYDNGGGFMPATDSGLGALTGNPTGAFAAGATSWSWQTGADIPGTSFGVMFRISVTDSVTGAFSQCVVTGLSVNNNPVPGPGS